MRTGARMCDNYSNNDKEGINVRLMDVYFVEKFVRNLFLYGLMMAKWCRISYRGQHRVVAALNDGAAVFDVGTRNNVVVVRAKECELDTTSLDVLTSVQAQHEADSVHNVQKGRLCTFAKCLRTLISTLTSRWPKLLHQE